MPETADAGPDCGRSGSRALGTRERVQPASASSHVRKRLVDGGEVEVLRVQGAADPLEHAFVLLVVRVGEHLEELGVTPGATAVLGRAGSAPGEAERVAL